MTIATRRAEGAQHVADTLAVTCYRHTWRIVLALLVTTSAASIPLLLARIALGGDPPLTLLRLVGLVGALVVAPILLARGLARAFAAELGVAGDAVIVTRRDLRVEIPRSAIVAVEPWTLPLPTPGASLRLRSGNRFAYDLGVADPGALIAFLAAHGALATERAADAALRRPGAAGRDAGRLRWWQWLVKFPLLGLLPTGVLFNAHQWIAYGGTLGEYYTYGAGAYLATFLEYWITTTIYLGLWAGLWRLVAEIGVWIVARTAPAAVGGARRAAELGCRLLYYGGVPALVALRFLP